MVKFLNLWKCTKSQRNKIIGVDVTKIITQSFICLKVSNVHITKLIAFTAYISCNSKSPAICSCASYECRSTHHLVAFQTLWKFQVIAVIFLSSHHWPNASEKTILFWALHVLNPAICTLTCETNLLIHTIYTALFSKKKQFDTAPCWLFSGRLSGLMISTNIVAIWTLAAWPAMHELIVGCESLFTILKSLIHAAYVINGANSLLIVVSQCRTCSATLLILDPNHVCHNHTKNQHDTSCPSH